jgi:acyl-CoA synthetase (NDP forming)
MPKKPAAAPLPSGRPSLDRVLDPKSIAIVGASEASQFAANSRGTLDSDADVFYVHPRHDSVFGQATYPSLRSIGKPVDAVLSLMSAERTTDLVEEAAKYGAGGVITVAGGFSEFGADGTVLQERLHAAAWAAQLPVIGPNGVGYINVPKKLDLTMLPHFSRRPGGVSMIAHSGATIEAMGAAAWRAGGVGFNLMISAGNEPVTDMADYLDYLVDDPATEIICLVVEKIRRPTAFFAAAARARAAGKPIVAVKLARTERTQRMALSHTGTLTRDAWIYEQAFKQAGILRADEIDELADRVQFLEQLPRARWSAVRGLFVFTGTGGFAAMAGDMADTEGVDIPEVERLSEFIGSVVPGATVPNPLDATGFMGSRPDIVEAIMNTYLTAPEFDTNIFLNQFAEWDVTVRAGAEAFAQRGQAAGGNATILAPLAGNGGQWLDDLRSKYGVAIGNGLRGCLRGLNTMAAFVRSRPDARVLDPASVAAAPRPATTAIDGESGPMLAFAATMDLLGAAGIPVAPYHLVRDPGDAGAVPFAGPYVVKLADVAHRTEHGAVRLAVPAAGLDAAVSELRGLADRDGLPKLVVVQKMIEAEGEAFIGIRSTSELGPVVAFGLGGIFVEVLGRVSGRLAPFIAADAAEMIAEFDDLGVLAGLRGRAAWDRDALATILVGVSQLAASGREWIDTFDINPLVVSADGFTAVDGLCLLRDEHRSRGKQGNVADARISDLSR